MSEPFKRFIAIGCTHGALIDKDAFAAVMGFARRYKPHTRIHLGDVCDYAAFRSGAPGTKDEAVMLEPDIKAGADCIRQFAPTDVLIGNHDERVWKLATHQNAVIAHAAGCSRNEFLTACNKAKVKRIIDHYSIRRSWIEYGGTKFLHGFMFNEMAIRDHAEHFGRCVIAHLHTPGMAHGRRSDNPTAYCVGTLANIENMDYAKARRATARWAHGFAWGEYNDRECVVNLCEAPFETPGAWRMPF